MNLRYAIQAFWTILRGKPHVYADKYSARVKGPSVYVRECVKNVTELYEKGEAENAIIEEVEQILNQSRIR